MDETHYTLLGVDTDASVDEINRAFRRLAKCHHPDRVKTAPSIPTETDRPSKRRRTGMFQRICDARNVLLDTEKRSQYNRQLFGQEQRKWRGSEARSFEDEFYHDMQTSTTKSLAEKPPPIIVRKSIHLTHWMSLRRYDELGELGSKARATYHNKLPIIIQFRRTSLCDACNGYANLPYHSRKKNAAIRVIPWNWGPEEYMEECHVCAGSGFTLSDTSLHSKQSRTQESGASYDTEAAYSTTITAQICACEACGGRKRVFKQKLKGRVLRSTRCSTCEGSGLASDEDSLMTLKDIPVPRHFDGTTMTSLVVLLEQGHQRLPNQCRGDVHVIYDLCIPKKMEMSVVSHSMETCEEAPEGPPQEDLELLGNPPICSEPRIAVTQDVRKVPMKLNPSPDGRHFKAKCSITLKDAVCSFYLDIPTYWTIPLRALLSQSIDTPVDDDDDDKQMAEFLRGLDSRGVESHDISLDGEVVWTGDEWGIRNGGPCACDYCLMPPFVFPDEKSHGNGHPKVMGRYPGFAPCLFAKQSQDEGWAFFGCAVSPERYTAHPENAHISLATPSVKITRAVWEALGKLYVVFKVERPPDHGSIPPMVYETFHWCCEKLGIQ